MGGSEGVGGRLAAKIVVLNYTHLHAFIAFSHLFLGVNVTGSNEPEFTAEARRRREKTRIRVVRGCG